MRRKTGAFLLTLILLLVGAYLYADRSILALKTGLTLPLQWDDPYAYQEEPLRLPSQVKRLSTPKVRLTPLYYLPESKKLQFGLWYDKKQYRPDVSLGIPDRIFRVTVMDKEGRLFDQDTVIRTTGVFDEFQRRSIAVDLSDQDSVEVTISLIEQKGNRVIPIQSSSFDVELE